MTMVAPRTIDLSWHAIERFGERMCQGIDLEVAAERLERLILTGTFSIDAPEWLCPPRAADAFLTVGDLVLPLRADTDELGVLVATTTLVRGGISHSERRARNRRRRRRSTRTPARPGSTPRPAG